MARYSMKEPAFAVMALLAISEANRPITLPLAAGVKMPSMIARLPAVRELALEAAGMLYATALIVVTVVAANVYCDR